MSLSGKMAKSMGKSPDDVARLVAAQGHKMSGGKPQTLPVQPSADFNRISALPRRPWDKFQAEDYVDAVTDALRTAEGTMRLRPIQAASLIEAQRSRGLLGFLGVGFGKCAGKDTEIFDVSRGVRRTVSEPGEMLVTSIWERTEKLSVQKATAFPSGEKQCVEVFLKDGTKIELSLDHPVYTSHGWVNAVDLQRGDLVAEPLHMPGPLKATEITDDEVIFIAYMMANGGVSQPMASFTSMDGPVLEEMFQISERVVGGMHEKDSDSIARQFYVQRTTSFRDRWGIHGLSKHKRVPASFWGLSDTHCALFINRFWACDGHVNKQGVECTLASEKLIDDLRFLLLRLGVSTRKHYSPKKLNGALFPAWTINANGQQALDFFNKVGFPLGKEEACRNAILKLSSTRRNTNTECVSANRKVLREIAEEMGPDFERDKARTFLGATDGQFVSREKFTAFCEKFNYSGKYARLTHNDIRWERVKTITALGVRPVYDLSVEETHNFVANGVVIHNSLVSYLLPVVMDLNPVLLLVPASLVEQTKRQVAVMAKHWKLDTQNLHVLSYSMLSSPRQSEILETLKPALIIADEASNLKNRQSVRTKRFRRYMHENPGTRFVPLSGTLTSRSLKDYAHLAEFALRDNSPVPLSWPVLQEWCQALDSDVPDHLRKPMGVLSRFAESPADDARAAFRRRLIATPGVVATAESELGTSLIFNSRTLTLPENVEHALAKMAATWQRPDGEMFSDILEFARAARQLSCGFWYKWLWPNDEPDWEWLTARAEWHVAVREKLKRSEPGMDSPLLLFNAAAQGRWSCPEFAAWAAVKHRPLPPVEAQWVNDTFLIDDAVAWGKEEPGIIWYEHDAVGQKIAERGGFKFYAAGKQASSEILDETGKQTIVASIRAHGEGKNLQVAFGRNLITSPPSSGKTWEQTCGRTHREGQPRDEVTVDLYLHTASFTSAFHQARMDADYIQTTTGNRQKLVYGTYAFTPP